MNTKPAIENSNMHGEYQLQERGKQTIAAQNIDKSGSVASFCAEESSHIPPLLEQHQVITMNVCCLDDQD